MNLDIVSEAEFKRRLAFWLLDNDIGSFLPLNSTREDYAESFRLPDFDYKHYDSYADENGDLVTLLQSEVALKEWHARKPHGSKKFVFCKLIKTFTATSDVEPFPMGYIIIKT